jgi:TolB protein
VNLTNDPGRSDFAPAWSPDGTRIAFTRNEGFEEGALGPGEIFVMNADGSNRLNLTNDPANDINPSWSRDGSRMAFASNRTGDFEVFAMEADGSMPINLSNTTGAADLPGFPQAWSP